MQDSTILIDSLNGEQLMLPHNPSFDYHPAFVLVAGILAVFVFMILYIALIKIFSFIKDKIKKDNDHQKN